MIKDPKVEDGIRALTSDDGLLVGVSLGPVEVLGLTPADEGAGTRSSS